MLRPLAPNGEVRATVSTELRFVTRHQVHKPINSGLLLFGLLNEVGDVELPLSAKVILRGRLNLLTICRIDKNVIDALVCVV